MAIVRRKTKVRKELKPLQKIVCVVGPTSSGKTKLSLRLAHEMEGEVVNADARQCFTQFSIGTGKPVGTRGTYDGHRAFLVEGIPHHLMDFLPPQKVMTVAEWRELAMKTIDRIVARGHLPLVVGGTGMYIQSLVDNPLYPHVPPHPEMRKSYEGKPLSELVKLLLKVDPTAAEIVDIRNPRRVIRAIEVVTYTGKSLRAHYAKGEPLYETFQIGIRWPREELYRRIDREVEEMIERGWVDEIRDILKKKISLDAPAMTSIGYRELLSYLRGEKTLDRAIELCKQSVRRYAKRQETWFKRDPRIHWATNQDEAFEMVMRWKKETMI